MPMPEPRPITVDDLKRVRSAFLSLTNDKLLRGQLCLTDFAQVARVVARLAEELGGAENAALAIEALAELKD
jgi:hypothetical protein